MGPPPTLTTEQIAKQAERKAAKLAKKAAAKEAQGNAGRDLSVEQQAEAERCKFLKRDWVDLRAPSGSASDQKEAKSRAKIVTWNLLAQTLVRRELFPGSDCLRWSDRKPMLLAELAHHSSADIICLQECDRLKDFLPSLPHHSHVKGSGPGKLHGLVILYRSDRFVARDSRLVHLDYEELVSSADGDGLSTSDGHGKARRGGSRQTKNVGLVVALQEVEDPNKGIIVATTHLFWHPKYAYERVRQCIVLLRNVRQFQSEHEITSWPVVFAGDLNTQPSEATYHLLTSPSTQLPQFMIDEIDNSRVVHDSTTKITPPSSVPSNPLLNGIGSDTVSTSGTGTNTPAADDDDEKEGEGGGEDGGDVLPNTRQPSTHDGILPTSQLVDLMKAVNKGANSAYGSTQWSEAQGETFGGRGGYASVPGEAEIVQGRNEPAYTCYTPLFKLTLDYLLLLAPRDEDPISSPALFTSVLSPPLASQLSEGLPRKGICASDHLAVGCEIEW